MQGFLVLNTLNFTADTNSTCLFFFFFFAIFFFLFFFFTFFFFFLLYLLFFQSLFACFISPVNMFSIVITSPPPPPGKRKLIYVLLMHFFYPACGYVFIFLFIFFFFRNMHTSFIFPVYACEQHPFLQNMPCIHMRTKMFFLPVNEKSTLWKVKYRYAIMMNWSK